MFGIMVSWGVHRDYSTNKKAKTSIESVRVSIVATNSINAHQTIDSFITIRSSHPPSTNHFLSASDMVRFQHWQNGTFTGVPCKHHTMLLCKHYRLRASGNTKSFSYMTRYKGMQLGIAIKPTIRKTRSSSGAVFHDDLRSERVTGHECSFQ